MERYITTACIIVIALIIQLVSSIVLGRYAKNIAAKTKTELDDKLIPLVRRLLKIVIWVVALIIILPVYGINISALIATLGVTSLAIALAAQDTIANIIAGFLIMIDGPFRIGDKIQLPSGEVVKVLNVEIRRSIFISEDDSKIIIVPNTDLSKNKIANFTYAEERKRDGKD